MNDPEKIKVLANALGELAMVLAMRYDIKSPEHKRLFEMREQILDTLDEPEPAEVSAYEKFMAENARDVGFKSTNWFRYRKAWDAALDAAAGLPSNYVSAFTRVYINDILALKTKPGDA